MSEGFDFSPLLTLAFPEDGKGRFEPPAMTARRLRSVELFVESLNRIWNSPAAAFSDTVMWRAYTGSMSGEIKRALTELAAAKRAFVEGSKPEEAVLVACRGFEVAWLGALGLAAAEELFEALSPKTA